ncbi:hypothetical protein [uncultured Clostridium sp.]|uniref:hypothetical protein n=1 Tax=uncultured Clostridium sp. TaxID=59620 RepID=UPI00259A6880|nr:hypothetical protein [uncultured Clostridium sp.]
MFILNNLIAMVFANIIIITSIYYGKIKKSAFITLTLFFLGLFGKIKLIPGYNIFIFRNLTENGAFKYVYLIYYLIFVLASLTLIIHAIESKKDFILNDYNL